MGSTAAPRAAVAGLLAVFTTLALAGCARHPRAVSGPSPAPSASVESPGDTLPPLPPVPPPDSYPPTGSPSPSTSGFGDLVAVPCAGRPGADQVLGALRQHPEFVPAGSNPTVYKGPLCAGTWQYSVITQQGREPLQVVTRSGPGGTLALVTAGTDVCTVEVRTGAPQGILAAANCRL
jgi:hypothetical protein